MENKSRRKGGLGMLPAHAPLANPYVPFQNNNPPTYAPRTALVRGTLYPGLDLPFQGKVNNKEKPVTAMTELQTMAFVLQELVLYLDTHRDDKDAFEVYCEYQMLYQDAKKQYEEKCGPLTNRTGCYGNGYRWLDDPWPWEYSANCGV